MIDTLRFITCGSVDDGKSTLIGRLLFDTKNILDDQLVALEKDSRKYGTQGEDLDLALLVDGLHAEREQGITIDVAYRFFSTEHRHFIVADTPGHEQYTRNMATGASTADLAVILIDARKGVLTQTCRHSRIVSMMGIKHIVLAINKMDLVNYDEIKFNSILDIYKNFAQELKFTSIYAIPMSALTGENISEKSVLMPWYNGVSLLKHLSTINPHDVIDNTNFIMPVQWVNRPNSDFRGICGRIASGKVDTGETVSIHPSGIEATIKSIYNGFDQVKSAALNDSITLTFDKEIDIGRGDFISSSAESIESANQFSSKFIWLSSDTFIPGKSYILKLACKEVTAVITKIKYREDINSGMHLTANKLELNDIATIEFRTSESIAFKPYLVNKRLGSFILIDKVSFETVGVGMINFALRRSQNIYKQKLEISKSTRANLKNQTPKCIWLTGHSGSGKSTIANLLEKQLYLSGRHTYILDGDNIRLGLNKNLGFTETDRIENIRRVAEVAKLMTDAGLIVIVSFISPFKNERKMARNLFSKKEFIEVFVDTPIEECERRDVKGLYAKARSGQLKNFTGIDSLYERPISPEVHLITKTSDPTSCVDQILKAMENS